MKIKFLSYAFLLMLAGRCLDLEQNPGEIRGKVVSAADRSALRGATIRVKGGSTVTLSDSSGNFRIGFAGGKATLQVSYVSGFRGHTGYMH